MAIYKPSNCKPFLGAMDLTKEQYFQCEINTSNVPIAGYKIQILDNLNNVIFEGSEYTLLNDYSMRNLGNTGLNGSILSVPLVVTDTSKQNENAIYYNGTVWLNFDGDIVSNFSNDYVNQPYKWRINLAQGITSGGQHPEVKWYDMTVTTGQVMGSIPNRIQSVLSENIYKDYYIQLCSSTFEETATLAEKASAFVGNRVRVSRYDNSFGYVYPQEGVVTDDQLSSASYFQIYKNTNDPEYVSTNRIVDYATTVSMGSAQIPLDEDYKSAPFEITQGANVYYDQNYTDVTQSAATKFVPYVCYYDTNANINSDVAVLSDSTRLLVKNESSGNTEASSPANGVFVYVSSEWIQNTAEGSDTTKGTLRVRWQRATDANSWASMIGKVFYVQSGSSSGLNFESSATANGVINSTPLSFQIEKPVELYPDNTTWETKNFGGVFKNTTTQTYVRPFVGLAENMLLNYVLNNTERSLSFTDVNSSNWYITHDGLSTALPPGTPYTVTSYFKDSDENPFYGYATPVVEIQNKDLINSSNDTAWSEEIQKRYISVIGTYSQAQNKTWKNFQWSLVDLVINYTTTTEVSYSGEIEATFEGLQENHRYELTLVIEDELGWVHTIMRSFIVNIGEIQDGGFPLEVTFDCPTQSIEIDFVKEGVVPPVPVPDLGETGSQKTTGVTYEAGVMTIADADSTNTIQERGYGVKYENVTFEIAREGGEPTLITDKLPGPQTNDMTISTQHVLNPYFDGTVFEVFVDIESQQLPQDRVVIRGVLPPEAAQGAKWYTIANPERNQIFVEYQQERSFDGGDTWDPVAGTLNRGYATIISNGVRQDTWRLSLQTQDDRIVFSKIKAGNSPSVNCDYLFTDKAYNITLSTEDAEDGHTEYLNLTSSYYNCDTQVIPFPLTSPSESQLDSQILSLLGETQAVSRDYRFQQFDVLTKEGTDYEPLYESANLPFFVRDYGGWTVLWTDYTLKLATQLDGRKLNVEDLGAPRRWEDKKTGTSQVWSDTSVYSTLLYYQVDANATENHSGRQEIESKVLTFNVAIKNFDPTQVTPSNVLEVIRQCFVRENNQRGGG